MWVISLRRLRQFWADHPRAETPLRGWHTRTVLADWHTFADLRETFPSADVVGNCTVFNIGGNHFRLVARVLFRSHKVYVLRVMTHAEYDEGAWPVQCGCHTDPPTPRRPVRPTDPKRRRRRSDSP